MKLARMSYNSNGWKMPSGINCKCAMNFGNTEYYEWLYNFGWEEWNADPKRYIYDYQYGFLQAINNNPSYRGNIYEDVILFSHKCDQNGIRERTLIVGFIPKLEVLTFNDSRIVRTFLTDNGMRNKMEKDIISVNGNVNQFNNDFNLCINMKFNKLEKKGIIFSEKIPIDILTFDQQLANYSFSELHDVNNLLEQRLGNKIIEIFAWIKDNKFNS